MQISSSRAAIAPSPIVPLSTPVFTLLPLSDLHLTAYPAATEMLLANRDYLTRMDHVVLLGDQVACYGTNREYQELDNFIRCLSRPYSPINGNHEFYFELHNEESPGYGELWAENSIGAKHSQLTKFRHFFDLDQLWRSEQNEFGTFVFLGLDGVEHHKAETLSQSQLEFLTYQMRDRDKAPLFVFCHAPLILKQLLNMEYYVTGWTAAVEAKEELLHAMEARSEPMFWMSGHIHLHPDHYLFAPYQLAPNVWQIHCPDSWGYSRWLREHIVPQRHQKLFSRHLEIEENRVNFVTHDHELKADVGRYVVEFRQ